jgi:hypothetical protein
MDPYLGAAHGWPPVRSWCTGRGPPSSAEVARAGARPAAELARVTRPGGALLASVYSTASRSAARDRVDVAASAASPSRTWYVAMKTNATPLLAAPSCCAGAEKAVEQR